MYLLLNMAIFSNSLKFQSIYLSFIKKQINNININTIDR